MSAIPSSGPEPTPVLGRRGFLAVATRALLWATGGAAAAALGRYLSYEPPAADPSRFTLEAPEAYPVGTRTLLTIAGAALYRDVGGFFARSLTCAHLGCRVRPADDGGFACPCHGSRFARVGNVVDGPAPRDLEGVALSLDEQGRLVLDMASWVDAAWRLSAPHTALEDRRADAAGSGG
jgi:cytochrome b6-f complex iron-sulfur subunit